MNKTAIKNFSIWARNTLIKDITYKAGLLGITQDGIAEPLPQSTEDMQLIDIGFGKILEINGKTKIKQRNMLIESIKDKEKSYKENFEMAIEEIAYTWFNRLIAIRFMEVNDYLPSRIRVLSSETPDKNEPDFVTNPFDTGFEFTEDEIRTIEYLQDKNKLDELFKMLFIKQCNELNKILPELFEIINSDEELLFNINYTDKDKLIYHLVHDIPEEDFNITEQGQVEIIGWLYQYYNTELNDFVYDGNYSRNKISKELLPPATTIYTPHWAVMYMVQNSLGKKYINSIIHNDSQSEKEIADSFGWKYYVAENNANTSINSNENIFIENLTFLDPCMGSGHILVYAFDLFMDIYRSIGYTDRDAVKNIIQNNLYGLDIDNRAKQLSYFAVMMKARSYDRRFFNKNITPNLCSIQESDTFDFSVLELFEELKTTAKKLADNFKYAKEYGSILKLSVTDDELTQIESKYTEIENTVYYNVFDKIKQKILKELFFPFLRQAIIMKKQYDIVCTNPPYLGSSRFSAKLDEYVKHNYKSVKSDLSIVMYKKSLETFGKSDSYIAFITTSSWMFLSSFEELRKYISRNATITSILDLGSEFFEGKVGHNLIVAWITFNQKIDYNLTAIRLVDYCYSRRNEKQDEFFNERNRYISNQNNFSKIPGSPIAYWVSKNVFNSYNNPCLDEIAKPRHGLATSDNNRFLKLWYEVDINKTSLKIRSDYSKKWFPMNKGGSYRRWYGNLDWVINYENNGQELKEFAISIYKCSTRTIQNTQFYFKKSITWSALTSGNFSVRWSDEGALFGSGGYCAFTDENIENYITALLNNKVASLFLNLVSPTLNYEVGHIKSIPIILDLNQKSSIDNLTQKNIAISKKDWDSFETSWDFEKNPIIAERDKTIYRLENGTYCTGSRHPSSFVDCYVGYVTECNSMFRVLKKYEEELNRIFIEIYGLQDELTPDVAYKDVTVHYICNTKEDIPETLKGSNYVLTKQDVIKDFVSYAVGCMFGRYSLNETGLIFAGGQWDISRYTTFIPTKDNCIPITDTQYFENDIVSRFEEFVGVVFGKDTLTQNLTFIAEALGNKGNTPREVIRNYFLDDFFKDHCKKYQKRPIYWLFDSGKEKGFRALVYMHRWNADTIGHVRVEYLHKVQRIYESEIAREQDTIDNTSNNREKSLATKRKEKLQKQLKETRDYDKLIANLALDRITIDLDDGVKVNYEKVQTSHDKKKLSILAKI